MSGRTLRWLMSLARPAPSAGGGAAARLTIIRHHRIYADRERPLYRLGVSESVFADQLAMLVAQDLAPITAIEGWRRLAEGRPGHWVAMTFDDGYEDNLTRALPRLEAVGARATFFLTAGLIERREAPWWDALAHALETTRTTRLEGNLEGRVLDLALGSDHERRRALRVLAGSLAQPPAERDRRLTALRDRLGVTAPAPCALIDWPGAAALLGAGMEVGGHTLRHPLLSRLDAAGQRLEIQGSLDLIERRLGVRPAGFAYPEGDYDAVTLEVIAASGLEYAVTTRPGTVRPGAARYELRRRGLSDGACLGPSGRFSRRLAMAELDGAFDRLRGVGVTA